MEGCEGVACAERWGDGVSIVLRDLRFGVDETREGSSLFLFLWCPLSVCLKFELTYFNALVALLDMIWLALDRSLGNADKTENCFKNSMVELYNFEGWSLSCWDGELPIELVVERYSQSIRIGFDGNVIERCIIDVHIGRLIKWRWSGIMMIAYLIIISDI